MNSEGKNDTGMAINGPLFKLISLSHYEMMFLFSTPLYTFKLSQ
jgi:hypothetical protein